MKAIFINGSPRKNKNGRVNSSFWSIGEVFKQRERVRKGWFPMNPKRKNEY